MKIYTLLFLSSISITFSLKSQENLKKKKDTLTECQFKRMSIIEDLNLCYGDPWIQVFEENFNGNIINPNVWENEGNNSRCRIGNPELQYYQDENIFLNNGILELRANRESITGKILDWECDYFLIKNFKGQYVTNLQTFPFTSGNLETKKRFPNGKFEALIKIPIGEGLWPAFWLYDGDPNYNELDIFEFWSDNDFELVTGNESSSQYKKIRTNSHRDYFNEGKNFTCSKSERMFDFSVDYVKYSVIWTKSKIEWYVNDELIRAENRYFNVLGQEICTINAFETLHEYMAFPNHSMSIILNLAIQCKECKDSNGEGFGPNENDVFPKSMLVDWVKFYVSSDCSDKIINESSQVPQSTQDYNFIVGGNVIIDCNYLLPQDNQLVIVADNSITLNPGFSTELGSEFTARIDQTVCAGSNLSENPNISSEFINETKSALVSEIIIFPNPTSELLNIEFNNLNSDDYNISIKNMDGVSVLNKIDCKNGLINVSRLIKGTYLIEFHDIKKNNFTFKKFIKGSLP